jgi:hypothetical protein
VGVIVLDSVGEREYDWVTLVVNDIVTLLQTVGLTDSVFVELWAAESVIGDSVDDTEVVLHVVGLTDSVFVELMIGESVIGDRVDITEVVLQVVGLTVIEAIELCVCDTLVDNVYGSDTVGDRPAEDEIVCEKIGDAEYKILDDTVWLSETEGEEVELNEVFVEGVCVPVVLPEVVCKRLLVSVELWVDGDVVIKVDSVWRGELEPEILVEGDIDDENVIESESDVVDECESSGDIDCIRL